MKYNLRMASFWLVLGTVCLCSFQGLWAQSAKRPASASGSNNQPGLTGASTGCGYSMGKGSAAPIRPQQRFGQAEGKFGQPRLLLVSDHNSDGDSDRPRIVGLWKVKFVSPNTPGTNDGMETVIDEGYATWHSDGTEIMNSGRPPITGNFCMGVWEKTRRGTYKLNHFGLSWDTTPIPTFIGPANIREEVILDKSENKYFGVFTIDQFDAKGKTVIMHIAGQVTAERITVD